MSEEPDWCAGPFKYSEQLEAENARALVHCAETIKRYQIDLDRCRELSELRLQSEQRLLAERDALRIENQRLRTALHKAEVLLMTGARVEVVAMHCRRALGDNK